MQRIWDTHTQLKFQSLASPTHCWYDDIVIWWNDVLMIWLYKVIWWVCSWHSWYDGMIIWWQDDLLIWLYIVMIWVFFFFWISFTLNPIWPAADRSLKKLLVGRGKKPQQIVHNFGGIEKSPLPNKSHGSDGRGFLKATHKQLKLLTGPPLLSSCLNCLTRGLARP